MMPGLMRSLEFFRKNKMNIGLASSGTTIYIELAIDKLSIRKYFNTVVSGDHVKMGKPDPEIYLLAAKRLGLHPEECVVLEDSTKGIQAAKSAGCKCIAVIDPYGPPQDQSEADIILESLNDISMQTLKKIEK